jgi:hypothetical protein
MATSVLGTTFCCYHRHVDTISHNLRREKKHHRVSGCRTASLVEFEMMETPVSAVCPMAVISIRSQERKSDEGTLPPIYKTKAAQLHVSWK